MINRFTKTEIDALVDALQLPNQIVVSNIILEDSQTKLCIMGVNCRKMNPKVTTVQKTQNQSKDKDKVQ